VGEHCAHHSHRDLLTTAGGAAEAGVRAGHVIQRKAENHHATTVHGELELRRPHIRPERDVVQDRLLHRVLDSLVPLDGPAALPGVAKHRGMLAGAVVVGTPGSDSRLAKNLCAAWSERLLRSAGEISLLEPEVREHLFDDRYVFRFSAVRAARHRELLVAPSHGVEAAAGDEGHDLERLGGGAPERHCSGVTGLANELVSLSDNRGVHAVV
jgi:hypothetical protein